MRSQTQKYCWDKNIVGWTCLKTSKLLWTLVLMVSITLVLLVRYIWLGYLEIVFPKKVRKILNSFGEALFWVRLKTSQILF